MIQIDNKLLVKLPDDAVDFKIEYSKHVITGKNMPELTYRLPNEGSMFCERIPPGSWQIIGETKSMTLDKLKLLGYEIIDELANCMEANKVPLEDNYLILIKK